jgi:hypothetical protein
LAARADAELGEYVLQVVLDSAAADEQPRADLGVSYCQDLWIKIV